ncbi:protein of unknown function [Stenotrophomonas maltophilia]|nr:protein of unknown function [Stenotrophomonas maltophilia]
MPSKYVKNLLPSKHTTAREPHLALNSRPARMTSGKRSSPISSTAALTNTTAHLDITGYLSLGTSASRPTWISCVQNAGQLEFQFSVALFLNL